MDSREAAKAQSYCFFNNMLRGFAASREEHIANDLRPARFYA